MLYRGFSLANVIILSALITLIGYAGLMIVNINSASSRAENTYLWAEKAANAGLLEAMKRIKATGFCDVNQTFMGNVGEATYEVNIRRSSRVCFIRSEGKLRGSRVVKTGILQAYYGVGLYTVRGNVLADLGTGVRLSGCDNTVRPLCFVPAFIASGTVNSAIPPQACSADTGGDGVYGGTTGEEAIITHVKYTDLVPLFFNVNCFNMYDSPGCDHGLLQVFEREYGINPSNNRQDMFFDNQWGIPRIDFSGLPPKGACEVSTSVVNLSSPDFTGCTDIVINYSGDVTIEGTINNYVNIYTLDNSNNLVYINSGVSSVGFTFYSTRPIKVLADLQNARIVTSNNVETAGDIVIRDSILILAPVNVNTTNDPDSPAILRTVDYEPITFENSYIFARHISFGKEASVYILDSLVYVYAHACPECDRSSNTSSMDKCKENIGWCGWYGEDIYLSVGRDSLGEERPSIIISNNSTVYQYFSQYTKCKCNNCKCNNCKCKNCKCKNCNCNCKCSEEDGSKIYIWGAFIGEYITYLAYEYSKEIQIDMNFKGFLVRNFPQDSTLEITISDDFELEFSKSLLDRASQNFWYFRKIQCIRDDINPRTQLIHTRLTAY